jgi:hypothetical protein
MDERVERATAFLREDRTDKMTSSLATQLAGFSATEVCDHDLQRRVLRNENSSPEDFSATMPSTEHVKAKSKKLVQLLSPRQPPQPLRFQRSVGGEFFFNVTQRKVA